MAKATSPPSPEVVIQEAKDRLTWLRAEYGPDDIDLLTFGPVVVLAERLLACLREPVESG